MKIKNNLQAIKERAVYNVGWRRKRKNKGYALWTSPVTIRDAEGNIKEIINPPPIAISRFVQRMKTYPTPAEKKIYAKLKTTLKKQKMYCTFQYPVYCHKQYFIIDIYIPKVKLAVELDGKHHLYNKKQIEIDNLRQSLLAEKGIKIIRFQNQEVWKDWKEVINQITGEIKVRLCAVSHKQTKALPQQQGKP